ncbi:MAG: family 10 glycosylhydrolase [bacterium]|nr:family 10 glycosylhydrolase [bacterium]
MVRKAALCLFVFLSIFAMQAQAGRRALWVTRWDFHAEPDVAIIMENAKSLHVTDVLFQVRGNATAFYPSKLEPWAWEMTGKTPATTGVDPGWDPLAAALREGHARGMRVHAWFNAFPGWRGTEGPPKSAHQLWTTHRSWFMIDHAGGFMWPTATWYSFISPGIPEAREHVAAVAGEIAKMYPEIDGIHLDYIRYPGNTELGRYRNFSFDKVSVNAFTREYGHKPRHESDEWSQFKCEQVKTAIQLIRDAIHKTDDKIELSATFFADIDRATSEKGQDPKEWLSGGLIDFGVPMAYQRSVSRFEELMTDMHARLGHEFDDKLVVGLLCTDVSGSIIADQMKEIAKGDYMGEALFAYSALFNDHVMLKKTAPIQSLWQEDAVKDLLGGISGP